MRAISVSRSLLLVAAVLAVVACSRGEKKVEKCHKPQEYQQAKPGPRVRVPPGMDKLSEEERLRLPYGDTQEQPIPKGEPCLAEPPQF